MERLQIVLEEEAKRELEIMASRGDMTLTQLMNAALTFFKWAVNKRAEGKCIASFQESVDQKESKRRIQEFIMPEIESIAASIRKEADQLSTILPSPNTQEQS
jgi:hypothetical protein